MTCPPFTRAFGGARVEGLGRLDREALLAGGALLLGDWFPEAAVDPARRAHGVAFPSAGERRAFDPGPRRRHAALRALTPPRLPPDERHWSTYPAVPVPDPGAALACQRWPDMGSAGGRFTALSRGGLRGQTFEIHVVARPVVRSLVATRGYVTCTAVQAAGAALDRRAAGLEAALGEELLPGGATALAQPAEASMLAQLALVSADPNAV